MDSPVHTINHRFQAAFPFNQRFQVAFKLDGAAAAFSPAAASARRRDHKPFTQEIVWERAE